MSWSIFFPMLISYPGDHPFFWFEPSTFVLDLHTLTYPVVAFELRAGVPIVDALYLLIDERDDG